MYQLSGPLLITANHPNSFLDAIIIATIFNKPIHFLARGDAFNKPWHNVLLRTLHMFPIYRMSEGKEFLKLNAAAIENSRNVLRKNGIVLIFIEGICVNKHELQPFKKSAARIASNCWKEGIPLKILPLGLAYSSFNKMGKSVLIQTEEIMNQKTLMPFEEEPRNYVFFNEILFEKIEKLVKIPDVKPSSTFFIKLLGKLGYLIHYPLFFLVRRIVLVKTKKTVFYDSVLFGSLFFCYPIYLVVLGIFLSMISLPIFYILLLIFLHPLLAYFATSTRKLTTS
jgi:1-acyl-sn-glycerol-3-phosphate acyltransferase